MRVGSMVDIAAMRQSGLPSLRYPSVLVDDTAERLDQKHDVVAQPIGDRRVLDSAGSSLLGDRAAIGIKHTLQNGQPDIRRIEQVIVGDELCPRARAG
jgi:hypothetical protein